VQRYEFFLYAVHFIKKIAIFVAKLKKIRQMHDYPDKMTMEQAKTFQADVLNIVSQIPRGKVTTYGDIAALAGWPSHSRMVGRTLRYTPGAEQLPCHRVVNKEGRTAPGWSQQRPLLEAEGVTFKSNGHVDMQRHLWEPE
jgi:O(6)-alkylguanine repair protein YbaZ